MTLIAIALSIFLMVPLTIDVDDLEVMHCVDDRKKDGYVYLLIDTTSYRDDIFAEVRYESENAYIKIKGCAVPAFGIFGEEFTPIQVDIEGKDIKNIYFEDGDETKLAL